MIDKITNFQKLESFTIYLLQRYFGRVTVEHSHGISSKAHTHQKFNAVTSTFHYDCIANSIIPQERAHHSQQM